MSFCENDACWQKPCADHGASPRSMQTGKTAVMSPRRNNPALIATIPVELACRVLEFCSWEARASTMRLNRHWLGLFQDDSVWRMMCAYLHADNFVYCPPIIPFATWKECFAHLWPVRKRWRGDGKTDETMTFTISVLARFRPLPPDGLEEKKIAAVETVLPLHQQIALMVQQGMTPAEARAQLFPNHTPDFFANAMLAEDEKTSRATTDAEPTVTLPPLTPLGEAEYVDSDYVDESEDASGKSKGKQESEDASKSKSKLQGRELGVVSVMPNAAVMCAPGVGIRRFDCFDRVFDVECTQSMIYEKAARKEVFEFLNGMNCTIMLYGQTGSGKTYTLFGADTISSTRIDHLSDQSGIVPRVCAEVMDALAERTKLGVTSILHVAYVEVYGDEVTDLLKGNVSTGQWQGTAARAVIEGTVSQRVQTKSELQRLLHLGELSKHQAATQMNERSSRAHALLFLFLDQTVMVDRKRVNVRSTLCMADLGGCEQLKKSGAKGERLKEAIHINMGLLALKQCITRLNKNRRMAVIPYNDSRLTQLLRSALGGDSKTTVVVTCSMESRHVLETIHALRFGEKCAVVQNVGGNKVSTIADQIAALDADIAKCRADIIRKERWLNAAAENKESFELEGHITTKSAMVGAEEENERLTQLLEWRAQLLGDQNVLSRIKIRKLKAYKPAEWKQ